MTARPPELEERPPKKCLTCGALLEGAHPGRKYCGEKNFESECATCGKLFKQKCQKRLTCYCGRHCQNSNPEVVARANAVREELGYLEENGRASLAKLKAKRGVENPSQLPEVKAKKAEKPQGFARPEQRVLFLEKHGVANASQLPWVKELKRKRALERYGVDNVSKAEEVKEKIRTTTREHHGVPCVLALPEVQRKSALNNKFRISKVNRNFQQELLERLGVEFELEAAVGSHFLADLGFEKLRIDLNPTVSHNFTISFPHATGACQREGCDSPKHAPRPKDYHQKRALLAGEEGLLLLQRFDWHDPEVFLSVVASKLKRSPRTVYARKTQVVELKQAVANAFLKEHHLLGGTRGQTVCLGLVAGDELLHVQTYGRARMNSSVQWEAIRSASKKFTHVPGAFSRCEKHFLREHRPESMISYVDLATSLQGSERVLEGWEFSHTTDPTATWVKLFKTEGNALFPKFLSDSSVRRLSADRMLGFAPGEHFPRWDGEGRAVGNDRLLESQGFVKVYACGARAFKWRAGE